MMERGTPECAVNLGINRFKSVQGVIPQRERYHRECCMAMIFLLTEFQI
jgi:hypothetical protein